MNNNFNKIIHNHIKKIEGYKSKNNYLNNNIKKSFQQPIGLYDPYGENINPLTGAPYTNLYSDKKKIYKSGPLKGQEFSITYKNLAYLWTHMKVYEFLNPILESINKNQVTIIRASTGVGKTVIIPKIALQSFNFQKKVICTVPKQIVAVENAEFSAQCLDVRLGHEVGYFYMGKNETRDSTKLTFTTPGSLKSKITGSDPYLSEYSCVIIDEIHERSVQTDQLLLLMKTVLEKRPEFRLILMSATVDLTIFKEYFTVKSNFTYNEIDIIEPSFDIKIYYEKKPISTNDWKKEAINKIMHILTTTETGDILVFIKAGGDGNLIKDEIYKKTKDLRGINPFCAVLEAKTPSEDRDYATKEFNYKMHPDMDPNNPFNRKVVMSTNVAESSLTVDGVIYVIDCGYSYEAAFYPLESAESLMEERISQAAADQRKGRAGRTQPGVCYRLYTEDEFKKFKKFPIPDIQKTDITSDLLDIYSLNYIKNTGDAKKFLESLIAVPSNDFISSSLNKLVGLDAINGSSNEGTITELGRAISQFRAVECNFGKSILASYFYHCKYDVIYIILISMQIDSRIENVFDRYSPKDKRLTEKEIKKEKEAFLKMQKSFNSPYGDYFTLLNIYYALRDYMKSNENANARFWCKKNGISSRTFINRGYPKKAHWDLIGEKSRKLNYILMDIVRPVHLKLKYFEMYKNDGGRESIEELMNQLIRSNSSVNIKNYYNSYVKNGGIKSINELMLKSINNRSVIDLEEDILETGIDMNPNTIQSNNNIMKGGSKPYEINLFPGATDMGSKEKNILMALGIGNITNLAILNEESKNKSYMTCFPIKKVQANIDPKSTLSLKNRTKIVLYNTLFTTYKDQKILKLNLVTKIPPDVMLAIRDQYKLMKLCNVKNSIKDSIKKNIPKTNHKKKNYKITRKISRKK
jgi:HrpA-like RNA helicase